MPLARDEMVETSREPRDRSYRIPIVESITRSSGVTSTMMSACMRSSIQQDLVFGGQEGKLDIQVTQVLTRVADGGAFEKSS